MKRPCRLLAALLLWGAAGGYCAQDESEDSAQGARASTRSTFPAVPEVSGAAVPGQKGTSEIDEAELLRRYRAYKAESARDRGPQQAPAGPKPAAAKRPAKQPDKPKPAAAKEKAKPEPPEQDDGAGSEEAFLRQVVAIGEVQKQPASKGQGVQAQAPGDAKSGAERGAWRRASKPAPAEPLTAAPRAWVALLLLLAVPAVFLGLWRFVMGRQMGWQAHLTSAMREKVSREAQAPPLAREPRAPQAEAAPARKPEAKPAQPKQDVRPALEPPKGRTLRQVLSEGGAVSIAKAFAILRPVCEAVELAHSRNMVRGDIGPSSIMVVEAGQARLIDPGPSGDLPKAAEPAYCAPELEKGFVCRESDVYSLGACLYEMLTGAPPFRPPASRVQKLRMDFAPASLRAPELPAKIDSLISRALEPSPDQRIKTARQFLNEFQQAVSS